MWRLKTKWFNRWAKKNAIVDSNLNSAIDSIKLSSKRANLGGCLFKVRIARRGKGTRVGFRTLIVLEKEKKSFFVYGFAKNEKSNISRLELKYFKKLASDLLKLDDAQIMDMVRKSELFFLEE